MELLSLRGLWLLGGLAPLVVFYILKIKRERLRVRGAFQKVVAAETFRVRKIEGELPDHTVGAGAGARHAQRAPERGLSV